MRIKRISIFVITLSFLSACAANAETQLSNNDQSISQPESGFKFSPIAHGHTAELLQFITHYTKLNETEQQTAYMAVVQALAENPDDLKLKIKRAAILAVPNSVQRDSKLAQQYLNALLADEQLSESNQSLVQLIHAFTLDHQNQVKKSNAITKKADSLKKKNKALSRKLNDIKNIEKTMIERNAQTAKP